MNPRTTFENFIQCCSPAVAVVPLPDALKIHVTTPAAISHTELRFCDVRSTDFFSSQPPKSCPVALQVNSSCNDAAESACDAFIWEDECRCGCLGLSSRCFAQ